MTRLHKLLLVTACLILVQKQSAQEGPPPIDDADDPLPTSAIAQIRPPHQWQGRVRAVAFSPDGNTLAWGGDDQVVHLWSVDQQKEIRQLKGHAKKILSIAFSPDGNVLATAGGSLDGEKSPVYLWEPATGKELRRLQAERGEVFSVAFSPNGKNLVTASDTVHLWEVASGKELPLAGIASMDLGGDISRVAYSSDGKTLAVASFAARVFLLDLVSGKTRRVLAKPRNSPFVAFSPDGKTLATAGGDSLRLWDVTTTQQQASFGGQVSFCTFAPNGKTVAWCAGDKAVRHTDLTTGKESQPFVGHRGAITCLAFSQDGNRLASGSADGTVLLWDVTGTLNGGQPQPFNLSAKEAAAFVAEDERGIPVPKNARVSLLLDKKEYFLGENILVHFCVENTGQELFQINLGADYRGAARSLRFSVRATDENGEAVPDPYPCGFCMGGMSHSPEIKPGQKHYESLSLMRYCRFEKAGVYRLHISHDLGWKETKGRKLPVAEATIKLMMPTAKQARQIVAQMDRLPKDHGGTSGQKREAYADYSTLIYPVYLPILSQQAANGSEQALEALGHMPTPEATQVLIGLLDHQDAGFARKALQKINGRLPDPQLEGKLGKRNPFDNDWEQPRRWLIGQSWRTEFAPSVRQAGRKLLTQTDVESLQCGAFVLTCLGEQEDLPALIRGLDQALSQTRERPKEENTYPRPRGACQELLRAARAMNLRGIEVSPAPQSPGEMVLFANTIGTHERFRPEGWEVTYARLLQHEVPYVREVALDHLPLPPPKLLRDLLPRLFTDKDVDVQIAACRVAKKTKAPELRGSVLQVLASAREDWLLREADNAAYALDVSFDRIQILVSRLDEEGMTAICLSHLASIVIADLSSHSCPTRKSLDVENGRTCKTVWQKFLREHADELKAGQRFRLADPGLSLKEMFPKFTFYPPARSSRSGPDS